MKSDIQNVIKDSIKDNRRLLTALGNEKPIKDIHHQEEDLISSLLNLLPKSAAGKIALLGAVGITAIVAWKLLHSK